MISFRFIEVLIELLNQEWPCAIVNKISKVSICLFNEFKHHHPIILLENLKILLLCLNEVDKLSHEIAFLYK